MIGLLKTYLFAEFVSCIITKFDNYVHQRLNNLDITLKVFQGYKLKFIDQWNLHRIDALFRVFHENKKRGKIIGMHWIVVNLRGYFENL